jgi:hypothetical protein
VAGWTTLALLAVSAGFAEDAQPAQEAAKEGPAPAQKAAETTPASPIPALKPETVGVPLVGSRLFIHALSPNPRGGWNFIAQFMNYKYTTDRETVRIPMDGGRSYVTFKDTQSRPDSEWVVVDLQAGTSRIVDMPGFHSGWACRAANGRIFFSVDFMHVVYYEPQEEALKMMGQLIEGKDGKPWTEHRCLGRLMLGQDDMVYGGTQAYNGVTALVQINPDTLEHRVYPNVGTGKRTGLTYAYYMAIDIPWVYIAVGQGDWELMAVHVETGETRCLAERRGTNARIVVTTGEKCCGAELVGPPERLNVLLSDGRIVAQAKPGLPFQAPAPAGPETPAPSKPDTNAEEGQEASEAEPAAPLPYTPMSQKSYKTLEWKHTKPWPWGTPPEVDVQGIAFDRDGKAAVHWRPAATTPPGATPPPAANTEAAGEWKEARFSIRRAEPIPIESLAALPDGSLLGNVKAYAGFFRYYRAEKKLEFLGKHGLSGPQMALADGKAYLCGYPNTHLYVYDPAKPWRSDPKVAPGDKSLNPYCLGAMGMGCTEAHFAKALVPGENQRLYLAGRRERWSTGTGLGYYDAATNKFFGLRTENKDMEPLALVVLPKLGRVVLSGTQPEWRIYDLDLNEVERLAVMPGLAQGGLICRTDIDSQILGYVANPQTKKSILYVYDLAEKKVLRKADVEGPADRLFRRPADGTFWAATPNALYRIDPNTPAIRTIGVTDRDMSCFTWAGIDLYAAHGGELVRITASAE